MAIQFNYVKNTRGGYSHMAKYTYARTARVPFSSVFVLERVSWCRPSGGVHFPGEYPPGYGAYGTLNKEKLGELSQGFPRGTCPRYSRVSTQMFPLFFIEDLS